MKSLLTRFIEKYWILLLIVVTKFILQFLVVNPIYELHRDEFLHLDQARHLAFGFISVPPFTSLISKIIFLLGGTIFWIRFFPALFGALTIVFVWLIIESIGGSLIAKIMASLSLLFSALVRLNILFQPNSFDILAWTIIFYFLVRYVQSEKRILLYYLALIIAVSLYNKYNPVFLLTGLLISFLILPQKKLLLTTDFLKAVLLVLLLFMPNIIWQGVNNFPVFRHMKVLKETQLDNNSSMGFIKEQLFFFLGSLPLILAALASFIWFKPFRKFRFIGISYLVIIALYAFLKAKNYYALGLYPVLLGFGSVYIEKLISVKWKIIVVPLLIGINLVICILSSKLVLPLLSPEEIRGKSLLFEKMGLLRWEDGKNHDLPQDYADMLGWHEMADKALIAYKMIPENELESTLVFCDNYGQTGALNYYNRSKMKEAYSFATDYIFWLPHLTTIRNIILVGKKPDEKIISMFKDIKLVGVVENEYAREKGTGVYLITGAIPALTDIFYKLAEERKKKFEIF